MDTVAGRESVGLAFNKLKIKDDMREELKAVISLTCAIGSSSAATDRPFRAAGRRRVEGRLKTLSRTLKNLADSIDDLDETSIKALADNGIMRHVLGTPSVYRSLSAGINAIDTSKIQVRLTRGTQQSVRRAQALGRVLMLEYSRLTGEQATRSTLPDGKPDGPFFTLVSDVFLALGISASPENTVREVMENRADPADL